VLPEPPERSGLKAMHACRKSEAMIPRIVNAANAKPVFAPAPRARDPWCGCRSPLLRSMVLVATIAFLVTSGQSNGAAPATSAASSAAQGSERQNRRPASEILARSNLVAWCVVPFDARKRNSEERAQMLLRLGIRRLAYDWREEHIPTFDTEIEVMQRQGIAIDAWWFPANLESTSRLILAALKRHQLKTQLWITMPDPNSTLDQSNKVSAAVRVLEPIVAAAGEIGCTVGLYNHGGWFGEPENQIAIIERLQRPNVGLIYNFHHGHEHIDRFPELLRKMQPYLLVVNLNGMVRGGDKTGNKILTLGSGTEELPMLRTLLQSGWRGRVGIIDHRPETDSEVTLRENLAGLDAILRKLSGP
jgi:hypothetical protein